MTESLFEKIYFGVMVAGCLLSVIAFVAAAIAVTFGWHMKYPRVDRACDALPIVGPWFCAGMMIWLMIGGFLWMTIWPSNIRVTIG